jgi:hypothetical protein
MARPTWAVTWTADGQQNTLFLCASCDEREIKEIENDE